MRLLHAATIHVPLGLMECLIVLGGLLRRPRPARRITGIGR